MTEVETVYGESLYELAKDEGLSASIAAELETLQTVFQQEPDYLRLLCSPTLTKAERCQIVDDGFRGRVHPYVLNFLKLLTERGYARYFPGCCDTFAKHYYRDSGILPVTAVTAVALSPVQAQRLTNKLGEVTGKKIKLTNPVDPTVLGGVRLDYDGQRLDDTVSHRLVAIQDALRKTVL